MTPEKFRQEVQRIVAKLALGAKLNVSDKKIIIRYRAQSVVRAGRVK